MNYRRLLPWLVVVGLPLAFGLTVDRQGIDLRGDGLWLLAAAEGGAESAAELSPASVLLLRAAFAWGGTSAATLDGLQLLLAILLAVFWFQLLRQRAIPGAPWIAALVVVAAGPSQLWPVLAAGSLLAFWLFAQISKWGTRPPILTFRRAHKTVRTRVLPG